MPITKAAFKVISKIATFSFLFKKTIRSTIANIKLAIAIEEILNSARPVI